MGALAVGLITLLGLFKSINCFENAQNYVVTNDNIVPMKGEVDTLIDFSNVRTVGREHFINGSMFIVEDMDDDNFAFTVEMYTSPNGDGDYKKMQMNVPKTKVCEGSKKFYKEFVQPSLTYDENTNIPYIGDDGLCPLPAGEYYLKDIEFNTESWPNQMPRGTLKIVIVFYKGDAMIGGLTVTMKIEDDT